MAKTNARNARARKKPAIPPTPTERTRANMRRGLRAERDVRRLSKQIGAAVLKRNEALGDLFMHLAVQIGRRAAVELLARRYPGVVDTNAPDLVRAPAAVEER